MNFGYLVLLIITLKNIDCYNPKRHTLTTSMNNFKNLKSKLSDAVIPARYQIKSTTNYEDPCNAQSFPSEYFPEVEYPESVADSAKPFYLSASPFPDEVKSTFNSLAAKANSKGKSTIDYSWPKNEKSKEIPSSQKEAENEITNTKGNEINSDDKSTNETLHEDITMLDVDDNAANDEILFPDKDMDKLFTNWSSTEQSAETKDMDYVLGFIKDLDEVMKNLTSAKTIEPKESYNSTVQEFQNECSDECKLLTSMTSVNNDTIIPMNGNSFLEGELPERIRNPLFEDSDTNEELTSLTSLLNEYITNATSVEDILSDCCSIGTIANETNTSCTET